MIKLDLPPKPAQLTTKFQAEKTLEFINSGKTKKVWGMEWLRKEVLAMSFSKCCYSEIKLEEEGKDPHIEHFYPKSKYPEKVLEWGNLLPSSNICNREKRDHDVGKEPIINPFVDNPKEFLYLQNYRFYAKTEKGAKTISVLKLNDRFKFGRKRAEIGEALKSRLQYRKNDIERLTADSNFRDIVEQVKDLLRKGNRKEEYAALTASTILNDDNFTFIEKSLRERDLWDNELEDLKRELFFCAL